VLEISYYFQYDHSPTKWRKKPEIPPALQGSPIGGWTPPVNPDAPKRKLRSYFTPSGIKELIIERQNTLWAYGLLGLSCTGVYVVLKSGMGIADFLASTSFYDVAYVSFMTGLGSGGVLVALFSATNRAFTVRPELVFKAAVKKIKADKKVIQHLGDKIDVGKFRAYTITDGGPRLFRRREEGKRDYTGWQRYYEPKKVQMILQLSGSKDTGMLSIDAAKEFSGAIDFQSMALDVLGSGERVQIIGQSGDDRIYKGIIQLR